jgi:hypothetical protein
VHTGSGLWRQEGGQNDEQEVGLGDGEAGWGSGGLVGVVTASGSTTVVARGSGDRRPYGMAWRSHGGRHGKPAGGCAGRPHGTT